MREYDVITDTDLKAFKKKVNQRIQDGWVCEGGIAIAQVSEKRGDGSIHDGEIEVTTTYAQVLRQ